MMMMILGRNKMKLEIDLKMKMNKENLIEAEEEFKKIWHKSAEVPKVKEIDGMVVVIVKACEVLRMVLN